MPITHLLQFDSLPQFNLEALSKDATAREAAHVIQGDLNNRDIVFGAVIQEPGSVQVITERSSVYDTAASKDATGSVFWTNPRSAFRVDLNRSVFEVNGPATANVVEFVRNHFPVSSLTPKFRAKIQQDFLKFNAALDKAKGRGEVAFGWTIDDDVHENIKDEKTRSWVVVAGWDSMEDFEQSLKSEAFGESIGILLSWNAPYQMWHSERKASL